MDLKYQPPTPPADENTFLLAMWSMYCRAPGRKTAPGEPVDLGEIGTDVEKKWVRWSPYAIARREP